MRPTPLLFLIGFLFSTWFILGCNAPSSGPDTTLPVERTQDLRVPDSFDWRTQRDISFTLTGYETGLMRFIAEDGTVYHQANLIDTQPYTFRLTVPAYMTEITVFYNGHEQKMRLDRPEITHTFRR
ncbi:MAG: hypothetical protein LAT75_10350 [Candidatus Cyclonatronum sp.]|uniref:hypothetical protein n=1 Tax=Cyclonatronum sp. TaxID=3024185 RepID=UPI0025BC3899|nr:hypothetical protein [Cyclonatronum sp.]MCH8487259.1 hypothetical protein [Cyclonatronum sp.]